MAVNAESEIFSTGLQSKDIDNSSFQMEEEEEESSLASCMMVTSPGIKNDEDSVPPYLPDDRVFCKDEHGAIYEAIIRKTSFADENWKFFVHYKGWNDRFDRWLKKCQILPDSKENRQLAAVWKEQQNERRQQQMNEQRMKKEKRKLGADRKRKKGGNDDFTNNVNGGGKRRRGPAGQDSDLLSFFTEACELPFTLQTILVEDQERIMRKGFDSLYNGYDNDMKPGPDWKPARDVHHLPAQVTIRTVLNHYVKIKRRDASSEKSAAVEAKARRFVDGLSDLFDRALPVMLLFQPERPQHLSLEANHSGKSKVDLYGCEYLLRLFVQLPQLLAHAPPSDVKATGKQLSDLIVLLQKNRNACFKPKYREPKYEELTEWEQSMKKLHPDHDTA